MVCVQGVVMAVQGHWLQVQVLGQTIWAWCAVCQPELTARAVCLEGRWALHGAVVVLVVEAMWRAA